MIRKVFVNLLILLSFGLWGNDNLLKNTNLSEVSPVGFPMAWTYRTNDPGKPFAPNSEGHGFILTRKEHSIVLSQVFPGKSGRYYLLSWEVKGDRECHYRTYVEWVSRQEGKNVRGGAGTSLRQAGENWKRQQLVFRLPEYPISTAYVAIIPGGAGTYEFRDLSLVETADPGILKNPRLIGDGAADGIPGWKLRSSRKCYVTDRAATGADVVLKGGGEGVVLVQSVPLTYNDTYEFTYEVKADSGKHRAYVSYAGICDGEKFIKNTLPHDYPNPKTWEKRTIRYRIPKPEGKLGASSFDLALIAPAGVDLYLRNMKLRKVSEKELETEQVKEIGGVWRPDGTSKIDVKDGKPLVIVPDGRANQAVLANIPVDPEQYYKLNYSVIGKGTANTSTGFHTFKVSAGFPGGKDMIEASWDDVWSQSPQRKEFIFQTPKNVDKLNISCQVGNGQVIFSEFALVKCNEPIEKKKSVVIRTPFYRNMIFASMPVKEISGDIYFPGDAASAKVVLSQDGNIIGSRDLDRSGPFSFNAERLEVGKYRLNVSFRAADGKEVHQVNEEIEKLKSAPVEVVMGPDRNFYVNGKVFFPVSDWALPFQDQEDGLYYAARHGINMIKPYWAGTETVAEMDRAHKYGIKVILFCTAAGGSSEADVKSYKHLIYNKFPEEVRNHPALLGYFMIDEPAWAGIPLARLTASYEAMKEIDPYHPVWLNEAPRGAMPVHRQYSKPCDIYGIDIYPVPWPSMHSGLEDKNMTSVGKYSEICYEATDRRKAVWMALQGFSWDALNRKVDKGTGYPTYRDLRFMVYNSLMNHANSIGFWGTQYVETPGFYDAMYRVTQELHAMSGIFTAPVGSFKVGSNNSDIQVVGYTVGGEHFILAANLTEKKQSVEINADLGGKRLMQINNGGQINVSSNKFNVSDFQEYEVRVYGTGPLPPPVYELPALDPAFDRLKDAPLVRHLRAIKNRNYYEGKANWIWAPQAATDHTWVSIAKTIDIGKPIKKATILCTADDSSSLYLNGKKVTDTEGCFKMITRELTLKPGANHIAWLAHNMTAACGAIAEVNIEYMDGTNQQIITDGSWFAAKGKFDDLTGNPAIAKSWDNAVIIAPYGQGAWENKVELSNNGGNK